jgi:hypothetical protein
MLLEIRCLDLCCWAKGLKAISVILFANIYGKNFYGGCLFLGMKVREGECCVYTVFYHNFIWRAITIKVFGRKVAFMAGKEVLRDVQIEER